jgi:hypothetical protein
VSLDERVRFDRRRVSDSERVKMALHGYERHAPSEVVRSPLILYNVRLGLSLSTSPAEKLCQLIGYVFLLRTSEALGLFTGTTVILEEKLGWYLYLVKYKGDPLKKGSSVFFLHGLVPPDMASMLRHLLPLAGSLSLVAAALNNTLKRVHGPGFVFHCHRHGRATDLFRGGLPLKELQRLGRWRTLSALVCYLH